MDYSDNWLRRLSAPRRNHFFTGKMMGVAQFEREQRYEMGQRWLLNRLTLGTGILCGLEVVVTDDGKHLRIERGAACDPLGREIVVARTVAPYDPFGKTGGECGYGEGPSISEPGDYLLCLLYRECLADDQPVTYAEDCSGAPDCQPDTTVETFALAVRPAPSPPAGFDCGAWIATDSSSAAPEPAAGTPPSIALLRERLIEQLSASCRDVPTDACVPLARITAARRDDGAWALSLSSVQPRVHIYSQTQLLDLVLCLASTVAKCCKDHVPTDPTTAADGSLRVNDLLIGTASQDTVTEVVPLTRIAGPEPPKYVIPSNGDVVMAITFNRAVDTQTLVLPTADDSPRSVSLHRKEATPGAADQLVTVRALAVPLNPSVWLLSITSTDGAATHSTGFRPGPAVSGVYTLRLSGTADPQTVTTGRRVPVASKADAAGAALVLNGEFNGTFPSGDQSAGGDFVLTFELLPPLDFSLSLDGVAVDRLRPGSWTWSANGVTVALDFSEELDASTVSAGIEIAATGTSMHAPPVVSATGKQVQIVVNVEQPQDPSQTNSIDFKLPKSTLRAADGRSFDHDVAFSIPIS